MSVRCLDALTISARAQTLHCVLTTYIQSVVPPCADRRLLLDRAYPDLDASRLSQGQHDRLGVAAVLKRAEPPQVFVGACLLAAVSNRRPNGRRHAELRHTPA